MTTNHSDVLYIVIEYELELDAYFIGYITECHSREDAEDAIRNRISAGVSPSNIRLFKATGCAFSVTTGVSIMPEDVSIMPEGGIDGE